MERDSELQSRLLHALNEATRGHFNTSHEDIYALAGELGMEPGRAKAVASRLFDEGQAKRMGQRGATITPHGRAVDEDAHWSAEQLAERDRVRGAVLAAIYEATGGDPRRAVDVVELAQRAGLERAAAVDLHEIFVDAGWTKRYGGGHTATITNAGIDVVQSREE